MTAEAGPRRPEGIVPTPEQASAIGHATTPLLLVAGAGTGKTTVMAERMLHLVHAGAAEPHELLGLTFTNKAAAHLKAEVLRRLPPGSDVTVATYHSFGASLVADHRLELGLERGTQVLTRAQAWQLLFAVFDEFRFEHRSAFVPRLVVDDAIQLASRCADHLVAISELEADCRQLVAGGGRWRMAETAAKRLELCQVIAAYDRRKRDRNVIDYGDQIRLAVQLLDEQPALAAELARQHPVVLLDEYQDTNYAQRVLLQRIYGPGAAITAVGDDMQSIYGFRGAHLANILRFPDHFPPATTRRLEVNRRSGATVVALANRIQAQVAGALDKELRPLDGAPPTTIECFVAADDAEEAATIAADITDMGPPWRRHAVLVRKRRLIPAIVAALEAARVPADVVGAGGLQTRPEVVDLTSWLEVLADPTAGTALVRLLEGPAYRIGRRDLAALARHARAARGPGPGGAGGGARRAPDLMAAILAGADGVAGLSASARARLARFAADHAELVTLARRLPLADLVDALMRRTGLWAAAGPGGRENLLRFLALAAEFRPVEGDHGLLSFVEYLRLLEESEESLPEAHLTDLDAVQVMTIHQAKGLEFPNVWLAGLAGGQGRGWGIFPDARAAENPLTNAAALPWWVRPDDEGLPDWRTATSEKAITEELRARREAEEWRLLYVACTRAQRRLVCSAAHWYPGPAEPQGPSAFYAFVASQTDLVTERFVHEPAGADPAVAAKERRRLAMSHRKAPAAVTGGDGDAAAGLPPAPASLPVARPVPEELTVSDLVAMARCPLQGFWTAMRPIPRPPSPAADLGTRVHRWIEEQAGRPLGLHEPVPASAAGAGAAGGGSAEHELRASFLAGPYAGRVPELVEAPFVLTVGDHRIRGRIDAAYADDSGLDVVDFKTGLPADPGDAGTPLQLHLYALAAVEVWGADPSGLRTTFCRLQAGQPPALEQLSWDADRVAGVRDRVAELLARLVAGRFDPAPGQWCRRCPYRRFCPDGQAAVSGAGGG